MGAFACQVGPEDVGHACLPLYHTNALSYSHLSTLWAGSTLVFQRRFSASRFWDCVTQHGCTWGIQIPFTLKALMTMPAPANRFRLWGLGGVDPPAVVRHFGIPCLGWFGMTETVSLPLVSTPNLKSRLGSMGTPTPGYEIEVRTEAGEPVGFGQTGHLWIRGVRGLSLFQEYLNDPEATAAAFDAHGWFRTGDRVSLHPTGVVFEGRDRDMLRVGAENVAESEIERVLLATGLVTEVAVVGKPHPMLDETPIAFIIPADGTNDPRPALAAACAEKLARFKRPQTLVLVEDLPRVTLGKIDKKALRLRAAELARAEQGD
jgi:crotonobetaine/carnitine-CoA ligase